MAVQAQTGDIADSSKPQGFLSKSRTSGSDASKATLDDYEKFMAANLSPAKTPAKYDPAMDGMLAARQEDLTSSEDFMPLRIVDRDEKKTVQKPLANDNNAAIAFISLIALVLKYSPMAWISIGVAFLTILMLLGVRIIKQRGLQTATVLSSSSSSFLENNALELKEPEAGDARVVADTTRRTAFGTAVAAATTAMLGTPQVALASGVSLEEAAKNAEKYRVQPGICTPTNPSQCTERYNKILDPRAGLSQEELAKRDERNNREFESLKGSLASMDYKPGSTGNQRK